MLNCFCRFSATSAVVLLLIAVGSSEALAQSGSINRGGGASTANPTSQGNRIRSHNTAPTAAQASAAGSGSRAPAGSGTRGSATRSASVNSAAGRSRPRVGGGTAGLAGIASIPAPRAVGQSSSFGGRSPFSGFGASSRAPSPYAVPLSTARPTQFLIRNGGSFPTGHQTIYQNFSHYYAR